MPHPDGLQCDLCQLWTCPPCLNDYCPSSCPPTLYEALTAYEGFNYHCIRCEPAVVLPQQFVAAQLKTKHKEETRKWLRSMGVSRRCFEHSADNHAQVRQSLLVDGIKDAVQVTSQPTTTTIAATAVTVTTATVTTTAQPTTTSITTTTAGLVAGGTLHGRPIAVPAILPTLYNPQPPLQVQAGVEAVGGGVGGVPGGPPLPGVGGLPGPTAPAPRAMDAPTAATTATATRAPAPAFATADPAAASSSSASDPANSNLPTGFALPPPGFPVAAQPALGQDAVFMMFQLMMQESARAREENRMFMERLAAMQQSQAQASTRAASNVSIRIPKPKLPMFSGDPVEWPHWWSAFESLVHAHTYPDQVKMDCLRESLEGGKAAIKIQGLCGLGQNYSAAITILQTEYGNAKLLQEQVWSQLGSIPDTSKTNFEEVLDSMRSRIQLLRTTAMDEAVLNHWATTYVDKQQHWLTQTLFLQRIQQGRQEQPWTATELVTAFECLLPLYRSRSATGTTGSPAGSNKPTARGGTKKPAYNGGNQKAEETSEFSLAMVQTGYSQGGSTGKGGSQRQAPSHPPRQKSQGQPSTQRRRVVYCSFCQTKDQHSSTDCDQYVEYANRKSRVMALRLCLNCLQDGHQARACPSTRNCRLCDRRHHTLLHQSSDDNQQKSGSSRPQVSKKTYPRANPVSKTQLNVHGGGEDYDSDDNDNLQCRQDTPGHSESICHDQIKMQIFKVKVSNPDTGDWTSATVCLDSGGVSNFIRTDVMEALDLPIVKEFPNHATGGFGDSECRSRDTALCELVMNTKQCLTPIKLCALTIPSICPPLTIRPMDLTEDESELLLTHKCLNRPPKKPYRTEIHILVGMEDYCRILYHSQVRFKTLRDGLVLHPSRLGYILSGCVDGSGFRRRKVQAALATSAASQQLCVDSGSRTAEPEKERDRLEKAKGLGLPQLCLSAETERDVPFVSNDTTSSEDIAQMYLMHTAGIEDEGTKTHEKALDNAIMQRFKDSVSFKDGKYVVSWPRKDYSESIPDNYGAAYSRTEQTIRSLCPAGKPTEKLAQYDRVFQDYRARGMLEEVPAEELGPVKPNQRPSSDTERPTAGSSGGGAPAAEVPLRFHLAHFAVEKVSPLGANFSKVRPVLDASQTVGEDKKSLNDMFHKGPDLMAKMLGSLSAARLPPFLAACDVAKAYLSVGLRREDRDCTRILWMKDPTKATLRGNLIVFRFLVVAFGIISSSFLLHATLHHHLDLNPGPLSNRLRSTFYADNFGIPAYSNADALQVYHDSKQLLLKGGFNLREWVSNSTELNDSLPEEDRHPRLSQGSEVSLLGLTWNFQADTFSAARPSQTIVDLYHRLSSQRLWTKRLASMYVAKVGYDALGLLLPVTIKGRLLIQTAWQLDLLWDQVGPADFQDLAIAVLGEFLQLHTVSWPRRIIMDCSIGVTLAACVDASEKAIAAAIYVIQHQGQETTSHLVLAKGKNAQKGSKAKKPSRTIPQLELNAALLGTRALLSTREYLKLPVIGLHLFSDSEIVLWQLRNQRDLSGYVQRRVDEINKAQMVHHHLIGSLNPADLPSRGVSLVEGTSTLWRHGPPLFKALPADQWPVFGNVSVEQENEFLQLLQLTDAQEAKEDELPSPFDIDADDYSTFYGLINRTAWVGRACRAFLRRPFSRLSFATAEERRQALLQWIRYEQRSQFQASFDAIQKGKRDQLTRNLDLYLDRNGTLRLGGRLSYAPLAFGAKHPLLLGRKRRFTFLVVMSVHDMLGHSRARPTLNVVRSQFWIPQGLAEVNDILKKCNRCLLLFSGALEPPPMAQLPPARTIADVAFSHVGLDHTGELRCRVQLPTGHVLLRSHVLVLVCLWSRALSLQVCLSTSCEETIMAIQRHVARFGRPLCLYSDSASGFSKAARILSHKDAEVHLHAAAKKAAEDFIDWKFSTPTAPWTGGAWEAAVKAAKKMIKHIFWRRTVTLPVLWTAVSQGEAWANSRPISPAKGEVRDADTEVLTPADLISPCGRVNAPLFLSDADDPADPDWTPANLSSSLNKGFEQGQKRIKEARRVFKEQYLIELREAHQTHFNKRQGDKAWAPRIGSIYLVQDPTADRQKWQRIVVTRLLPGRDGYCRTVEVRTPSGHITRRAVRQLVPLEAELHLDAVTTSSKPQQPESEPEKAAGAAPGPAQPGAQEEASERGSSGDEAESATATTPKATHPYHTRSKGKMGLPATLAISLLLCFGSPTSARPTSTAPSLNSNGHSSPHSGSSVNVASKAHSGKGSVESLQYGLICPEGTGGQPFLLPRHSSTSCTPPTSLTPHFQTFQGNIWSMRDEVPTAPAALCWKELTRVCTSTGFLGSGGISQLPTTTRRRLDFASCAVANSTASWGGVALVRSPLAPHLLSTNLSLEIEYRWPLEVCTEVANFFVERGLVSTLDGARLAASMVDATSCPPEPGSCDVEDAVLIWPADFWSSRPCPFQSKGPVEIHKDGANVFVPSLGLGLTVQHYPSQPHRCLPPTVWATAQRFWLQPLTAVKAFPDQPARQADVPQSPILPDSPPDLLRAQLNWVVQELEERRHMDLALQQQFWCRLREQSLATAHALLRLDPAEGVRALSGKEDLTAYTRDGFIFVNHCLHVKIQKVYTNHQLDGACFRFTPVKIEGSDRTYFRPSSDSLHLVPNSPTAPCDEVSRSSPNLAAGAAYVDELAGSHWHLQDLLDNLGSEKPLRFLKSPPLHRQRIGYSRQAMLEWGRTIPLLHQQLEATISYAASIHGGSQLAEAALLGLGHTAVELHNGTLRLLGQLGSTAIDGVTGITQGLLSPVEEILADAGKAWAVILVFIFFGLAIGYAHHKGVFSKCMRQCRSHSRRRRRRRLATRAGHSDGVKTTSSLLKLKRRSAQGQSTGNHQ
jgi:hypothetical protein